MKNVSINNFIFGDSSSGEIVKRILSNQLAFPDANSGKNGLVLFGNYGSGKSTLAPLLCEWIEFVRSGCEMYVLPTITVVNSSSSAGTIAKIDQQSRVISMNESGIHYFILDEADNMTVQAQQNIKGLMSARSNCVFILTTNHKATIDKGMLNRSYELNMNPASPMSYVPLLRDIAMEMHNVRLSEAQLETVAKVGNGCWRNMLPALDLACLKSNGASINLSTFQFPVSVKKGA
jgi:DNA polymerase III delta prime subunit